MMTPHRCPVCNGTGLVPNGFYAVIGVDTYSDISTAGITCRSCNGSGIVWPPVPDMFDITHRYREGDNPTNIEVTTYCPLQGIGRFVPEAYGPPQQQAGVLKYKIIEEE